MEANDPALAPLSLAARRSNARRSTGPRSEAGKRRVSLNALKHGAYTRGVAESMKALGENPAAYRRLLADLLEAHRPATLSEALLVEDLAALRWQRRRCERAQASKLALSRHAFEREQSREVVERRRRWWARQADLPPGGGLRYAPESESKFTELSDLLFDLRERFELGDFSDATRHILRHIYGESPTERGLPIVKLVESATRPGTPETFRRAAQRALVSALGEDHRDALQEQEAYLNEVCLPDGSARQAWLAPEGEAWRHLLRQQMAIDRQIERKLRLLLQIQAQREKRERQPPSPDGPDEP